jgi:predicted O-linked N-acetylglucosamine transferase (SPINDLY family)
MPSDATELAGRGVALLAADRPGEALPLLRAAVDAGDAAPPTLLNLALAEDRAGDRALARRQMRGIADWLPDWDEPHLRLAESLRAERDIEAASQAYDAVLARNPRRPEALIALGVLRLGQGDIAGATSLLLRCCGIAPGNAEAWDALGLALLSGSDAEAAVGAFAEAHRLVPRWLDPALHLVEAVCAAGTAEAELARMDLAVRADPGDPVSTIARGMLLERLGRRAEAIDALEVAVALAPDAPRPAAMLGGILARTGRVAAAEAALRRAGTLDPDNPQIGNDRAAVLMRMHRHAEARATFEDVRARHGNQVGVLCNLANATACCGLQQEAVALAEQAIALAPDLSLPRRALANTLPYQDGTTGAALLAATVACSDRLPRGPVPQWGNAPDPDRRLRLGLMSGSLRTHPVGWLTVAGFESLDPAAFEITVLAQHAATDSIARRFRAIAADWQDVDTMPDPVLADLARSLGIDVLIDLGGYGDAGRMTACAHRLAPVQVKWVGMQTHSTGLAEMDWFLTDRWETPDGFETLYTERLLRLPDGYVCYCPPPYAPDMVPLPALANGHVTFGCFNNLAKITPRAIAAWAAILHQVPLSRLVLKTHQFADPGTADRIRAAFAAHGIAAVRLELRGGSRHRAFLGEYNGIDIALDPFPYSGGLTTCEALWMGVPTVALPGEIFASRHSASHLSNAGLADWVATDLDDYIAIAAARALDLDTLAALRVGLRARTKASPLCDAPRFGRALGGALRHAWHEWCARR